MTDASHTPVTTLGDPDAVPLEGDVTELPEHHDHAIMNRRLDEDAV